MSSRISKLTAAIAEFESEIESLNQQKAELSAQPPATEAGITPGEIARAARQSSLDDQKRRSELESINSAIATLAEYLKRRQSELAQAQREERREALSSDVESARAKIGQVVDAANKLSEQLQAQLIELKTLANEAQPTYAQLQREFTNAGVKPKEFLKIEFTGIPVIVKQGENFAIEGRVLDLLWAEREAKSELEAEMQARRINQKSQFEVAKQRREAEKLAKHQAALEAQRSAKEIELEIFKQKLREARDSGYSNVSAIEAAIAQTHQEILDLNKEIHELKAKIMEAQNGTAA